MSPDASRLKHYQRMFIPVVFSNKDLFGVLQDRHSVYVFARTRGQAKRIVLVDTEEEEGRLDHQAYSIVHKSLGTC